MAGRVRTSAGSVALRGWTTTRVLRLVVPAAAAGVVLVLGLPRVSGAHWSATAAVLHEVSLRDLALLAVVWQVGLWVHTVALAAAMPGLSRARAYFLNLTGSAASNVLPLGGAAGTVVNYWSCRQWGFDRGAFVRWALVTNLWDNGIRLLLPAVATAWLSLDAGAPRALVDVAVTGLALAVAYLGAAWLVLHRPWGDRALERVADRWAALTGGAPTGPRGWDERVAAFRRETLALVRRSRTPMTVGKLAYAAAQGVLLWLCLEVTGSAPSPAAVFAAFAVERTFSLAVVTPGGSGVVELGTVGVLVALGVSGPAAVAAVLLYRLFVFVLEIPGGVLLLAGSEMARHWSATRHATGR